MKTIILSLIFAFSVSCANAQSKKGTQSKKAIQSKKDSISLRTDIEAISQGREVKSKKQQSVVRSRALRVKVDTAALKRDNNSPTPPSPNNPNPHEPVPSVTNAEPPSTPVPHPVPPAGTP